MLKRYIFIVLFLLSGCSSEEYLTYSDLISLLDIADNETKVENYLTERGLKFSYEDSRGSLKTKLYDKYIGKNEYVIAVSHNTDTGLPSVNEYSKISDRWDYYNQIVSGNGYKQTNSETKANGDLVIYYSNSEYEITLVKGNVQGEDQYILMLRKATD
ncbi:MAG: hypothetical protein LC102_10210 [Ignavibacteriales bacterium]|jgi:hypothetical protein|nr:MAG: hypothetical protein F9K26_11890 [Ignavibacteriaceae bacterium]MBW7873557.1 hypothetical protein [Ignavibacteria bacterium]MCZ2143788.1 hypothetical protein [Ignavibacteriales bacterium]OQY70030.1 MAG: hypothetical protein B6D45_11890 [Ignavibacteriales bacterium UTCHB3]MBV6445941.1 hypothetical protein [Ignavibacteriaceae bacterium]